MFHSIHVYMNNFNISLEDFNIYFLPFLLISLESRSGEEPETKETIVKTSCFWSKFYIVKTLKCL